MAKVGDYSKATLRIIVERIREELWPREDPDKEWSSDELENITAILADYDLAGPEEQ